MRFTKFGCLLLVSKVLLFQQNEFTVIFEHAEVISHDAIYVNVASAHTYKYNRTQAVVNLTVGITRDMGNELQVEVQAYKMASNEYRLFPLRFMFNFCNYVTRNEFGLGDLFQCANITGCPLKKRVYNMCMWKPNGAKFPPHIPQGSYKMDMKCFYRDIDILFFQTYFTIKYPEIPGYSFF